MLSGMASRWLNQTITRYAYSALDAYGQETYAAEGTEISCRIDALEQKIIDAQGREIVSTTKILMDGDETIDVKDKIVLPDNSEPKILKVEENVDPDGGAHHIIIYT